MPAQVAGLLGPWIWRLLNSRPNSPNPLIFLAWKKSQSQPSQDTLMRTYHVCRSLNSDFLALDRLSLWNNDREDAILQASLDSILINTSWEREVATEFSNRAL
jgi:hypothetical protein